MTQLRRDERSRYLNRMFGRIAGRYDLLNTVMSGGRHYSWRRKAAEMADNGLSGVALDVATGTGDLAIALASRSGIKQVVGLDFTSEMVRLADEKTRRKGLQSSISYVVGDALTLPFSDDEFVCATVGFGVRNFVDLPMALSELKRVVQPGGRVVILEIVRPDGRDILSRLFRTYFRFVTPWIGFFLAGDREAYTYLPESVGEFLSAKELASRMSDSQFCNIQVQSVAMGTVSIHVGQV